MGYLLERNKQNEIIPFDEPYEIKILMSSLEEVVITSIICVVLIGVIITIVCLVKNYCSKNRDINKRFNNITNNEKNYTPFFNDKNQINSISQKKQKAVEMKSLEHGNRNYNNNKINAVSLHKHGRKKRKNNYDNYFCINNENIYSNENNDLNYNNNIINENTRNNNYINNNTLNSKTAIFSSDMMLEENGFIIININKEPEIGLANIGATCYMNATLQCLSHTIRLANFFLDKKHEKKIRSKKFSREFLEVIKKLWIKSYNKNKTYYEPYNFKQIISDMNPLFEGVQANDAKDLINFILQQLHEELNEPNKVIGNNSFKVDQYNERQMFHDFLEEFKKSHRSIISDIFFFIIETKTECLNCKQRNQMNGIYNPMYLYNFQIMNFLIFPLEEVRKYKIIQYQQNFQEVNLIDCFNYYQKIDFMQGENQMWCKYCQQNSPSQYMTLLYSAPIDLILILNRGKGNIYNVKLNFDEIFDIGNYVYLKNNNSLIYHLYAVVTHIGPSDMGGHFVAFCKSPIDNKWYKYNDAIVELIGNFQDIVNFSVPYILFYEGQNL